MIAKIATVFLVFCLSWFLVAGQQPGPLVAAVVPEDCLGCLCQASTNCNMTISCTDGGLCGPFLISWPYWADAGKFVLSKDSPDSPGAYDRCARDPICAGETVRGYMSKFAQDCNGDAVVNCDDYARLHILGGYGCAAPVQQTQFYRNYLQCRDVVASLSGR